MKKLISLIIPIYNESENIQALYQQLSVLFENLSYYLEIVFINDGSQDNSLLQLIALNQADSRVKIIDFSRNFGKEAALTAGIEFAKGDAVIPFDADLQDPPAYIPALIQKWEEGYEIVNAVREKREGETWLKKLTAYFFYRCINKLGNINIIQDAGDFRLLSRRVIEALKKLPERRRFMKGLFSWVGFKTGAISYRRAPRFLGKTSWNYWKLWNLALEGITSFSQVPLQISTYMGFFVALFSFIYGLYMIIKTLFLGNLVAGYPSLMVTILFMGGIQLMALGIIGEYLGRIFDEVKQQPIYVISNKWL